MTPAEEHEMVAIAWANVDMMEGYLRKMVASCCNEARGYVAKARKMPRIGLTCLQLAHDARRDAREVRAVAATFARARGENDLQLAVLALARAGQLFTKTTEGR